MPSVVAQCYWHSFCGCFVMRQKAGKTVTFCTVFSGNHKSNSCCVSAFAQIDVGRVYARRRSCTCCKWCALCSLQVWWNLIRNGAVSGAHLLLCSLLLRWRANISPLSLGSAYALYCNCCENDIRASVRFFSFTLLENTHCIWPPVPLDLSLENRNTGNERGNESASKLTRSEV